MALDEGAHSASLGQEKPFEIRPLSDVLGAEIIGLDVSRPLDGEAKSALYEAFLKYKLLCIRDQKLTQEQQVAFSEQFGTLERHAVSNRNNAGGNPLVHIVNNLGPDGKPSGKVKSTMWHSDKSFRPEPSMATILHAVTLPPDGGDTCFANMAAAYEALDEATKSELEGVKVIHSWELSRENIGRKLSQEEIDDAPPMSHPLARVHPETQTKALFMGMHASHLDGLPMEEGRRRIIELEEHATQDRFVYRHNWRQGDVLMWDNRCLLHRADPNFDAAHFPRVMHRTCLRGTPTS
jgi:taurine dioxygenase